MRSVDYYLIALQDLIREMIIDRRNIKKKKL